MKKSFKLALSGALIVMSFLFAILASKTSLSGLSMWGGFMSFMTAAIGIVFLIITFSEEDSDSSHKSYYD